MKTLLAVLPLLSFCILFCLPAQAQQSREHYPIGQIVQMEGKAWYISPDKRKKTLRVDDPIYLNSVVETAPGAKLLILFIDDTQLTLGENTNLVIDEYIFDPYDAEENEAAFDIMKGTFHMLSGMIGKRDLAQAFRMCIQRRRDRLDIHHGDDAR